MTLENISSMSVTLREKFYQHVKAPEETPENMYETTSYYMIKFDLYQQGKRNLGWHWPAFFLGPIWGVYRRLPRLLYWWDLLVFFILMSVCGVYTYIYPGSFEQLINQNEIQSWSKEKWSLSIFALVIFAIYHFILGRKMNIYYIRKILKRIKKDLPIKPPSPLRGFFAYLITYRLP